MGLKLHFLKFLIHSCTLAFLTSKFPHKYHCWKSPLHIKFVFYFSLKKLNLTLPSEFFYIICQIGIVYTSICISLHNSCIFKTCLNNLFATSNMFLLRYFSREGKYFSKLYYLNFSFNVAHNFCFALKFSFILAKVPRQFITDNWKR